MAKPIRLRTSKGRPLATFYDRWERNCIIQENDVGGGLWLGLDETGKKMLLTPSIVSSLLPLLHIFAETGKLKPKRSDQKPKP